MARNTTFRVGVLSVVAITLAWSEETPELLDELVVYARRDGNAARSEGDFAISLPGGRGYEDVVAAIPNMQQGTPGTTAFALRGLGQDNVMFTVNTESNVLVNVTTGGIQESYATLVCVAPMMWDVAEVSLVRGPVLFGSGITAMGGELRLEPRAPQFVHEGRLTGEVAEYGTWRMGITENLVLLPDKLALRLNFTEEQSDGAVTNLFDGNDEYAATHHRMFRGQLRYRPNANDTEVYDLRVDVERAGGNTFGHAQSLPGHDLFERVANVNYSASLPTDRVAAILKGRRELENGWWLEGEASYQWLDGAHFADFDGSSMLDWVYNYHAREQRITGGMRFGQNRENFNWTGGVYAETSTYQFTFSGVGLGPVPDGRPFWMLIDEDVDILAGFVHGEWQYAPHLWLTGGMRLDYQSRSQETAATLDGMDRGSGVIDADQAEWLPKLGTEWRDNGALAGVSIARLYRPPGASSAPSLGISHPYGPERGWEIDGFAEKKWEHLSASLRVFHAWVDDQQVPYIAPGGFPVLDNFITNDAKSQRNGVEMEVTWRKDAFSAGLTAGYLHTTFDELVVNGVNRAGQDFTFAPEWTVGVGVAWKPATGWFGETSWNWVDTCYSQVDSPVATKLDARLLVSARAGYRWKNAEAYAFGSNLLDEEYAASKTDFRSVGLPLMARLGTPRMLGVGVSLNW